MMMVTTDSTKMVRPMAMAAPNLPESRSLTQGRALTLDQQSSHPFPGPPLGRGRPDDNAATSGCSRNLFQPWLRHRAARVRARLLTGGRGGVPGVPTHPHQQMSRWPSSLGHSQAPSGRGGKHGAPGRRPGSEGGRGGAARMVRRPACRASAPRGMARWAGRARWRCGGCPEGRQTEGPQSPSRPCLRPGPVPGRGRCSGAAPSTLKHGRWAGGTRPGGCGCPLSLASTSLAGSRPARGARARPARGASLTLCRRGGEMLIGMGLRGPLSPGLPHRVRHPCSPHVSLHLRPGAACTPGPSLFPSQRRTLHVSFDLQSPPL